MLRSCDRDRCIPYHTIRLDIVLKKLISADKLIVTRIPEPVPYGVRVGGRAWIGRRRARAGLLCVMRCFNCNCKLKAGTIRYGLPLGSALIPRRIGAEALQTYESPVGATLRTAEGRQPSDSSSG